MWKQHISLFSLYKVVVLQGPVSFLFIYFFQRLLKSSWNGNFLNACYWYYCDLFIHAYVYFSFYTVIFNQNFITWSSAMPYFSNHFIRINPPLSLKAHIQLCLHSVNNQWTDKVSALHFCYIMSQYKRSLYLCDMDLHLSPVRFFSYFLEAKCLEK